MSPAGLGRTFTDRVYEGRNKFGRVRLSVCLHSRLFKRLTVYLNFCMCMGHDHNSSGIENQGRRSRVKVTQDSRSNEVGPFDLHPCLVV